MAHPPEKQDADEAPGVPGFHSWRGVYLFVFTVFLIMVGLLALLTRALA